MPSKREEFTCCFKFLGLILATSESDRQTTLDNTPVTWGSALLFWLEQGMGIRLKKSSLTVPEEDLKENKMHWNRSCSEKSCVPVLQGLILLLMLLQAGNSIAQKKKYTYEDIKDQRDFGRFRYLEIKGHTGYHLYDAGPLKRSFDGGYGAIQARYGWQSKDTASWESQYGYPSYGVGYYSGFIGDPAVLGKPNAVFGFISFPLTPSGHRNTLHLDPSLGFTFNLEPFDTDSNPTNDAIGTDVAVFFNLALSASYRLTRELDLVYGIDFTHFSAGRIRTPNHGINMYGLNLAFRYYYNADQRWVDNDPFTRDLVQSRFERPRKRPNTPMGENSIEVYLAGGTVQNVEDQGTDNRYFVFSGVLDYRYRFNNMHGISAGADFFFDESMKVRYPDDQTLVGLHAGYDFMFGRFSTRFHFGAYLEDDKGKDPLYARFAFRYDLNRWLFAQIGVKTKETTRADWMELGIGITPFRW